MTMLAYLVHLMVYEFLLFLCAVPLVAVVLVLPETLSEGPLRSVLHFIGVVFALTCVFGGSWLAHTASSKRVFEDGGFSEALQSAFAEARLYMSFLPLVGALFSDRRLKESRFERHDDRPFE